MPGRVRIKFIDLEYELLWDSLGRQPRARQLLRLLAHEGPKQRFSTKLLQRYNLPHSTVSVALKNLVEMGLVWPKKWGAGVSWIPCSLSGSRDLEEIDILHLKTSGSEHSRNGVDIWEICSAI